MPPTLIFAYLNRKVQLMSNVNRAVFKKGICLICVEHIRKTLYRNKNLTVIFEVFHGVN